MDATNIGEVVIKRSSREIPCLDGRKGYVSWFQDRTGEVWLNAMDMGMGAIGKPNTCENCIRWRSCSVKDRDQCPGDAMPSKADPNVTNEQLVDAIDHACRRSYERGVLQNKEHAK